jgi:hypothetical protein
VEFYSNSTCTSPSLGGSAEAMTGASPNTTTWIAANGLATAPAGTTRVLFICAGIIAVGSYDRMYFRPQSSPGGF